MADNGKNKNTNASSSRGNETALMIEGLYNGIAYDLQKLRRDLSEELKYSSLQVSSAFELLEQSGAAKDKSAKDELSAVCNSLKKDMDELKNILTENAELSSTELKYGYQQNQMIYESLSELLGKAQTKLDTLEGKVELLEAVEKELAELKEKLDAFSVQEPDYEAIAETVKEKVVEALPKPAELNADELAETVKDRVIGALPLPEDVDYDKITEQVSEKTEASVALHSKEVLDAVAAIPVAENVDYTRIVEEVSDKVMEKLDQYLAEKLASLLPKNEELDYDKVIYGTAEKVVECIPFPEKIDYDRIAELTKAPEQTPEEEDAAAEKIANAVLQKLPAPEIDYDLLAEKVSQKIVIPAVEAPVVEEKPLDCEQIANEVLANLDYDVLAEKVSQKIVLPVAEENPEDDDRLASLVAAKVVIPEQPAPTYDILVDEEGVRAIAEKVVVPKPEKTEIDYAALADELVEKMPNPSYEMLIDDNGVEMIAAAVAEKLAGAVCEPAPVEEPVEEANAEELVETDAPVEEPVEEPVQEEIAVAEAPTEEAEIDYDDASQLVDAENGLVVRLKRSFTAKLRQSAPEVKSYYSAIKNAMTSYKRLNSNVSWHGDRFNYGRETVAKMNINGKTLCFYIALDPSNPEFKTTVYHQKDVGGQKAYESTPFMIKVKSETGAKRAVRLVGYLAEKLGAVKNEKHVDVDYLTEFAYASTKELIDEGLIKVTKEKKVVFNFN